MSILLANSDVRRSTHMTRRISFVLWWSSIMRCLINRLEAFNLNVSNFAFNCERDNFTLPAWQSNCQTRARRAHDSLESSNCSYVNQIWFQHMPSHERRNFQVWHCYVTPSKSYGHIHSTRLIETILVKSIWYTLKICFVFSPPARW